MILDDVGSYPLPDGVSREMVQIAFESGRFDQISGYLEDAMQQKIDAGIEVPNYPQFQDMNRQFLRFIVDPSSTVEPFVVKNEAAKIVELELLEDFARRYEERGERMKVRACVTGPVELCLREFGSSIYEDVLMNFSRSVNSFLKNCRMKNADVITVSIDEPSIGIYPLNISMDAIIRSLEVASSGIDADVQIHLHAPVAYETICEVEGIDVIGVESASDPSHLDFLRKDVLESYDKFLRIGISRTDYLRMDDPIGSERAEVIADRLRNAYRKFGERIKYVGPDCGLGTWPSQRMAFSLLKNTSDGVKLFRSSVV